MTAFTFRVCRGGVVAGGLLLAAALPVPASACEAGAAAATVLGIEEGDTLRIDPAVEGTTAVRPAGIRLAEGAGEALAELVAGADVCLGFAETRRDRYGRLLADVHRRDGTWLQGELLRRGLARVEPSPDVRGLAAPMLAIEREARAARAGGWRSEAFRIRTPDDVASTAGSFRIVEGRVLDAARRQDRWYLNFGHDWRTDFTVVIPKPALAAFAQAGVEPYALKGKIIRVRGWVDLQNGPMIEVVVPEQVEIVDDPVP